MSELKRVLVANRGEIAIRIAKAARDLGMEAVGVYAKADEWSLHTRFMTSAYHLPDKSDDARGPVAAYLDAQAVVAIASEAGCDSIHPGYGFLSESAELARLCEQSGLRFVGPGIRALEIFGDKSRALELARSLSVPTIPGSDGPVADVGEAVSVAASLGYPVMLKAVAGGGGRGMREVASPDDMADAFSRCAGEAMGAFGNATLLVEKRLVRPRHIEVQVLADGRGGAIHLYERDCSIQQRHQKVIEIAPAPALDMALSERLHTDALKLVAATDYANAGTVEFLVVPETGEHFFIECNPRIQVEHTVTEEVTGVDLVAAQLRIAGGATLAELELASTPACVGFAVQARLVAAGVGRLDAYKEPGGAGVRVDAMGYQGYVPPPEFDPLIAKVIGSAARSGTVGAALRKTRSALDEFHIKGLPTNIGLLRAVLDHPAVVAGDARVSLLDEDQALAQTTAQPAHDALSFLEERNRIHGTGGSPPPLVTHDSGPRLEVGAGEVAVRAPMAGAVVECGVATGDEVSAQQTVLVLSAMKMECAVPAPCSGEVIALLDLTPGQPLSANQVLAVIRPTADTTATTGAPPAESWQPVLDDVATLRALADQRLAPGSAEPGVVRQRNRGKLTCRERIALLLDADSFKEVGSLAGFASYDETGEIVDFTPANHVGGWGRIDGRTAVVCADDFTSRGGHADGAIGQKSRYLDKLSLELHAPSVRLLDGSSGGGSVATMVPKQGTEGESNARESSGAIKAGRPRVAGGGGSFLPGHLGSGMYTEQLHSVPVVNMLLGSVVGIGAAKAVLGHFSVMVRDIAQLFVAGPPVVSHAMGYDITKEDLGGWHIHCRNGSVDNLAESESEAVAMTRRFLSYLPSSVYETPPVSAPVADDPPDRREDELLTIIPRKRTNTFDIRRCIELLADHGSFFEVGPLWGTDQVVGFIRMNGHPMGVIASDSQHTNGGALTADGCDKLKRHIDLCDLFHVPILNLVDNPGFAVGLEHEIAGTIRKGGEWMVAFAQIEVPIFTVLMRRSFGVAGNNYATPLARPSVRVIWPAADVGGIPPEGGIEAAYKRQLAEAEDPKALREELNARIESVRGPIGPLSRFEMEEMIDPRDTRAYVCEWIEMAYQVIAQPARLKARALQFRP